MLKLYTAPAPNGRKASIALEELGVEYEVVNAHGKTREDWFLDDVNPNGKIPAIVDDGLLVWESGAILHYLAEKHGKLLPADPSARVHALQWCFFQAAHIGPNLGRLGEAVRAEGDERSPRMIEVFSKEVLRVLGVLDSALADDRPYLVGEYTIADIMHYPWLSILVGMKLPGIMELPRVVAWLERIGERPAVLRGMAVPEA